MKRSKIDLIISILLSISILSFLYYLIISKNKSILTFTEIIFSITCLIIILYLIKNMVLKKQEKVVSYDLNCDNIKDFITDKLMKDSFTLSIDETKENIRIKHYKREKGKNSMYMVSVIECNLLNDKLIEVIDYSIRNQCKRDKHENITYLYSIPIIIVNKTNNIFFKNIKVEVLKNMITIYSGISISEGKLYLLDKNMGSNVIKHYEAKTKLLELLDIKESKNEEK